MDIFLIDFSNAFNFSNALICFNPFMSIFHLCLLSLSFATTGHNPSFCNTVVSKCAWMKDI